MEKDIQRLEDIKIDQSTVVQQALQYGKGVVIINDNRHNIIAGDTSGMSWKGILAMALEKAPEPRLKNIEAEIVKIAERKFKTKTASGKFLGIERSTFGMKLKQVEIFLLEENNKVEVERGNEVNTLTGD